MRMVQPQSEIRKTIQELVSKYPEEVILAILDELPWPPSVEVQRHYIRHGDDNNGTLTIVFGEDGDGWVEIISDTDPNDSTFSHRFRGFFGGGESLRTRTALIVLAKAIELDNKDRPQQRPLLET